MQYWEIVKTKISLKDGDLNQILSIKVQGDNVQLWAEGHAHLNNYRTTLSKERAIEALNEAIEYIRGNES